MSTVDKTNITTAEQLLQLPDDFGPCELVRGELIMMSPGGDCHGRVQDNIYRPLSVFVHEHKLGLVYPSDTGFVLEPDQRTVRAPDVAFVCADRASRKPSMGFFPAPPDLAVEVRSPPDRVPDILAKIAMYLEVGVQVVWDVDPVSKTVAIYRPESASKLLHSGDTLTEERLLPGFAIPLKDIFPWD